DSHADLAFPGDAWCESVRLEQGVAPPRFEILGDHFGAKLSSGGLRRPSQRLARSRGVAEQGFNLCRAEVARVDPNDFVAWFQAGLDAPAHGIDDADFFDAAAGEAKGDAEVLGRTDQELPDGILLPGGDDEVARLFLLQHQPLHADIVPRMTPIAQGIEVAEVEAVLESLADIAKAACDLAGYEGLAPARALVIEEQAVARIDPVRLTIIDRDPMGIELGDGVG